jgi:D-alanyl-D-alanine dipeptidase
MPVDPASVAARRARAAQACGERGITALLLTPGSDLAYLSGYRMHASERLTCLVLARSGDATLVVPELEAPRARAAAGDLHLEVWRETDDPLALIAARVEGDGALGIADQMWASFTLRLQERLGGRRFVAASTVTRDLRVRKDAAEISALRDVSRAADRAYARARELPFGGRTESEIAADIARALLEEGHDEVSFTIVGAGEDGASPHHETGPRRIAAGDAVVLDVGGVRAHYCSDITRTVTVGEPADAEARRVHDVVLRAQEAGYGAAREGSKARDVDSAARQVIADAGYGPFFIHRTGHGIGLDGHEPPYLVAGNDERLLPGMAFSIEPGIYLPGRFGVRIEDVAVIGNDGRAEPLNTVDRSLAIVR